VPDRNKLEIKSSTLTTVPHNTHITTILNTACNLKLQISITFTANHRAAFSTTINANKISKTNDRIRYSEKLLFAIPLVPLFAITLGLQIS
jgi:hypothetical protein